MKYACGSVLMCLVVCAAISCGGGGTQSSTPQPIPSGGSNTTQGQLSAAPGNISFGNVQVDASSSKTVQLTNSGGTTVTVSSASTSGPGFRISGLSLPADVAPGQSITFSIGFNPSSSGASTGSVNLTNNGAVSPVSIALSGTGVAAVAHQVTATWDASVSPVVGYNVYRAGKSGGPYAKLNSGLVASTFYTDTAVTAGASYYYVVTAVAAGNIESKYSSEAKAIVPTP